MHRSLAEIVERVRPVDYPTAVCAHRGDCSSAPENTLAAVRGAMEFGIPLVEVDVRVTGDGQVVLFHDRKIDRTTSGTGRLRATPLESLRGLSAGGWFSEEFADERVPTLVEVLEAVRGRIVPLLDVREAFARSNGLAERLVEEIAACGMVGDVVLICREPAWVERLHALERGLCLVALAFRGKTAMRYATELPVRGVAVWYRVADARLIREVHRRGRFIMPWTVNDPRHLRSYADCGADAVITDCPRLFLDILEEAELDRARLVLHHSRRRMDERPLGTA